MKNEDLNKQTLAALSAKSVMNACKGKQNFVRTHVISRISMVAHKCHGKTLQEQQSKNFHVKSF